MRIRPDRGMSLIELIVVLGVFTLLLTVAAQSFFASLRGSNKSQVTTKVKQNADYVLSVMERSLHFATGASCAGNEVSFTDSDGKSSSFSCANNTVTLDGGSLVSTDDVQVSPCSITCSQDKTTVFLDMTFKAGSDTTTRAEEKSSLNLNTRILLRN